MTKKLACLALISLLAACGTANHSCCGKKGYWPHAEEAKAPAAHPAGDHNSHDHH